MQLTSDNFGTTYNFETYTLSRFTGMFFADLLSANTLKALGEDPEAMHQQHIGSLPPGTGPYNSYHYARFIDGNDKSFYIGLPWINPTTLQEADVSTRVLRIRGASQEQINALTSYMLQLRITDFDVT